MRTDSQIQTDVIEALKLDPSVNHQHIGISVLDGIVTLSGTVPSYIEKSAAEKTAQRVAGVRAVVEKIDVKIPGLFHRDDQSIAQAVVQHLEWNTQVPTDKIKTVVENGKVRLTGEVAWEYQRQAAENCVKGLTGVQGISNLITIKTKQVHADIIKSNIVDALRREALREAQSIGVDVQGSKVTLSGSVHSFNELEDIKWAAWATPGVLSVENKVNIIPY